MITRRLFANPTLTDFLKVDSNRLEASQEYRGEVLYWVFPPAVHRGHNQSPTLRWVHSQ